MEIDRELNLVLPIRFAVQKIADPNDATKEIEVNVPSLWAYSAPLSRQVFEANWRVLAAAKADIYGKGRSYTIGSAPSVAALAIREAAKAISEESGEPITDALFAEFRRLTTVLNPTDDGYALLPIDVALKQQIISAEDWSEAESSIAFFTCAYVMEPRASRVAIARFHASIIGASITSLSPTEFAKSLRTSTPAETSAQTLESSLPS